MKPSLPIVIPFPKMDAELKTKWLAALRSGEYEQGQKSLCVVTHELTQNPKYSFCCLGVLGSIAGVPRSNLKLFSQLSYMDRDDLLGTWDPEPKELRSFGREDTDTWTTAQRYLAGMNDSGYTFVEIADWIETNL